MSSQGITTTPKSARKRILFSGSPKDESSDDTLGYLSPLSSSPDRYSSPPPSPQWLSETPPKSTLRSMHDGSPIGPTHISHPVPKSCAGKFPHLSPSLVLKRLSTHMVSPGISNFDGKTGKDDEMDLMKGQSGTTGNDVISQAELSTTSNDKFSHLSSLHYDMIPRKHNKKVEEDVGMELVHESPLKSISNSGLMTPFKCLAAKEKKVEETPKEKAQNMVIGESPDISSLPAPVKNIHKIRPSIFESTVEVKKSQLSENVNKIHSLPSILFYPRARAALFPEHGNSLSSTVEKKRKRSPSSEPLHVHKRNYFRPNHNSSRMKRRRCGEINAGVHHKIRRLKPKKPKPVKYHPAYTAKPKITPEDRLIHYFESTDQKYFLEAGANEPVLEPVQTSKIVEQVPSPPPDPTKKFFKTSRTLKVNTSATVTVDANIKLRVSNGKITLSKPQGQSRFCKTPKLTTTNDKEKTGVSFEPIGDEKSQAEEVQEKVHDNVNMLLQKLEETPAKEEDIIQNEILLSPNRHITALATSTSSLAISDDLVPHTDHVQNTQPSISNEGSQSEGVQLENTPNIQDAENNDENGKKFYPLFYKHSSPKNTLTDISNIKSPRGTKRPWRATGDDQYFIDAGQKKFGCTQCQECELVYEVGNPEEELMHIRFHKNRFCLKYSVHKNERVVSYYGSDKVILIKGSDYKNGMNKFKNVMELVDRELGYSDSGLQFDENNQTYLYVNGKQVLGCIMAHPITQGYKMLISEIEGCDCCSEEAYPAKCGISRIWVSGKHRRKRIATKILDCIRSSFIPGYILGKNEIAFSSPTADGKAFAERYTGSPNYLVYI